MAEIRKLIQCKSCNGTGVYVGMAERDGAAVVCRTCKGTGAFVYKFEYEEFTGRKEREGVTRVYKDSYGYVIAPIKLTFEQRRNRIVEIDMTTEGVSYKEFKEGKMPKHIKQLACPMLADQSACHDIGGFIDECNKVNGGYINYIPDCVNQPNKAECWKRFFASALSIK